MSAIAEVIGLLQQPTLTVEELAQVLRIGRNNAYGMVRRGEVRSIRCGSRIIIPAAGVRELLGADRRTSSSWLPREI